ncbi:MAG: GNAT family N-acetyltransferase [Candidatus Helarchaeota archaeon]|nr:GNAT family N-acetyltransferase [Candidatus Helarchaeota archaeon]
MKLKTTLVEDLDRLYEIKDAWSDLVPKSASPWIFSLPEWSIAFLKTFGSDCRLHLALAWEDGKLVGILPLVEQRGKAHDLFLTRYEPVSGLRADYQAPIIQAGSENHLLEHLFEHLPRDRKGVLRWPHLPENHPTLPLFRRYFQTRGWPWSETLSYCSRYLFPATYREVEQSWSRKHRKEVRRQRRKLQQIGRLALEVLDDPKEIHDWLSEFFEVYSHKWRSEGLPSQFDDARIRIYYQELANQFLSKGLHVSSLKLDDRRIAYDFSFLHGGWFYDYTTTYRKEYHFYSPGLVHLSMLMDHGCAEKWTGFDFLQGHESYKNKWTSDGLTCVTFNVGINGGGFPYKWAADYEPKLRKGFGNLYTRLRFLFKGSKWI